MALPLADPAERLGLERAAQRHAREQVLLGRRWAARRLQIVRGVVHAGLGLLGQSARARREFLAVRVVEHAVVLPGLPRAFDGFRLLQLTDLHADLEPALIDVIIERLGELTFDQAVITGDFHDQVGTPWGPAVDLTLRLVPFLGSAPLAILGNHDLLAKVPVLEAGGLRVLLNENVALVRDAARLWICGVDDPHDFRTHDLAAAARGVPEGECRVLLAHSPEVAVEAAGFGYALQLSGHTHGGQICLPGGHILVRKAPVPTPLLAGPWRVGAMAGYTSRGTGGCTAAVRWFCPSEIVLHILRCA